VAEADGLKDFDFNKVSKPGKYLKFEAGSPVTLRILTKDPVVQQSVFTDQTTGEQNLSTKFCFVVWNFTDGMAQILSATSKMAKTFQKVGNDPDFGSNLQACDIKISPEGEKLTRVYDINVVRHSGNEKELTKAMIDEARAIDLDKDVKDSKGRASEYEPDTSANDYMESKEDYNQVPPKDTVIEDISDEPIDLSEIPF